MNAKMVRNLNNNDKHLLDTLACILRPSGYLPSVGEAARIADLSNGVTDRSLQKLCKWGYVQCVKQSRGRVRHRFMLTQTGIEFVVNERRIF